MTAPREVVIDGVRYVPAAAAVAAVPTAQDLLRALVAQWWGPDNIDEAVAKYASSLRVSVTDDDHIDDPDQTLEMFVVNVLQHMGGGVHAG